MAQHRLFAAIQEGGEEAAVERERCVTEGVDPWMNTVKTSGVQPASDGGPSDTGIEELLPADHAVLQPRQLRYRFCVEKGPGPGPHSTQNGHGVNLAARMSRSA